MFQSTRPLTLMQAFDFNVTDLRANRMGMMSARQQQKLRYEFPGGLTNLTVLSGLCWMLYMALGGYMYANHVAVISIQGAMAAGLLMGASYCVALMGWRWWSMEQETRNAQVEMVTGQLKVLSYYHFNEEGRYRIQVVDQELEISSRGFAALDKSRTYHFYVTPDSRLVLSAELVK